MQTEEVTGFGAIKQKVAGRFQAMAKANPFMVDYTRDDIWEVYHEAFETEEWKQENNCSACKSFIRAVGGIITVGPENLEVTTLWDFRGHAEVSEEYRAPLDALDRYVRSQPIKGLFCHTEPSAGVDKNLDSDGMTIWRHFHSKIPRAMQDKDGKVSRASASLRDDRNVLERGIKEISHDAVKTVIELIDQGSLYRGNEYLAIVKALDAAKARYEETPAKDRDAWCWLQAKSMGSAKSRARNTAIGTLLVDISEGEKDLEHCVRAFEKMVAPTNYKRPKAIVTPRMVEQAKEKLGELGLMSALDRRRLDTRDLTAADALFVHRPKKATKDVFDQISDEAPAAPKKLDKVEEIPVKDFVEKVVPNAESMRVLLERKHLNNLVCLTGPQDPEARSLMKWDNSFGWSYTGGVADSIKERVKRAGGRVDNVWMRCSLSWFNTDDLDLHLATRPNKGRREYIYYGHKRGSDIAAHLDVDMNASGRKVRDAVENIYIKEKLPPGKYEFRVHQYTLRETADEGFDVEIEIGDEILTYGSPTSPRQGSYSESIVLTVAADGSLSWGDCGLAKTASGMVKWGLKTGQFHTVRALTTSPNHWTRPQGNKHLFFLLEGCVADEKVRPFYNEFLTDALAKERKVCEVLGGKIEVAEAEGAELSGLGFSETVRNHLYVEVSGKFKRTVKVLF